MVGWRDGVREKGRQGGRGERPRGLTGAGFRGSIRLHRGRFIAGLGHMYDFETKAPISKPTLGSATGGFRIWHVARVDRTRGCGVGFAHLRARASTIVRARRFAACGFFFPGCERRCPSETPRAVPPAQYARRRGVSPPRAANTNARGPRGPSRVVCDRSETIGGRLLARRGRRSTILRVSGLSIPPPDR